MTRALARDPIYRRRQFSSETIEKCVRWYITYRLSYRDLVAMMAEQGVVVSHTTIMRWVLRYVPEYEKRWARHARQVNSSWRMDETSVTVRGGNYYLYRAVDRYGKSVDSLLCASRGREAAQAFFGAAVNRVESGWPSKINVDGHAATHLALRLLRQEDSRWQSVRVRSNRYLNNVIEQDHRAIKRRCASMLALKTFKTAKITLAGIELAHRIRKGQFLLPERRLGRISLKQMWEFALYPADHDSRPICAPDARSTLPAPELNIHRAPHPQSATGNRHSKPKRFARKIFAGRGLYQLVLPSGGRYWRYNYRYGGRARTLAYGVFPDVSLEKARARHLEAKRLLADGIDPSTRKQEIVSATRAA
jgi:transposase-like protein